MEIRFSIVITTYNRLSLLKRALTTALNQTIPCEVIIVDDCSDDGTQEYLDSYCQWCDDYPDKTLIYHRNSGNLGHSKSVNIGVEHATGKWIKLIDDDDYLATNCLEEISTVVSLYPQVVICSCQAAQVDEQENRLSLTRRVGNRQTLYVPQEDIHYGMLLELLPFGTPVQVAFRRDAFLESGGWNSHLDTNFDDIDSWVRIAKLGSAIFLNKCLGYRTVWSGAYNQSFSYQQRLETHIQIKHKIHECIHPKYQDIVPSCQEIENYLKLHWGLIGLKQRQFVFALGKLFPAIFSLKSWQIIFNKNDQDNYYYYNFQKFNPWQSGLNKNVLSNTILLTKNITLIRRYVKQRWGWHAWQQGKFLLGIKMALGCLVKPLACKLLLVAIFPNLYQIDVISRKKK